MAWRALSRDSNGRFIARSSPVTTTPTPKDQSGAQTPSSDLTHLSSLPPESEFSWTTSFQHSIAKGDYTPPTSPFQHIDYQNETNDEEHTCDIANLMMF